MQAARGGPGPDADRGLHLPDGRAHHHRRPDQVPARRRAGGVEAEGPDRAGEGLPGPHRGRRRGVLRRDRGGGRRGRQRASGRPAWRCPTRRRWRSSTTSTRSRPRCCDAEREQYAAYLDSFVDRRRRRDDHADAVPGAERGPAQGPGGRPQGAHHGRGRRQARRGLPGHRRPAEGLRRDRGWWTPRWPSPASSAPRSGWRCAATGRSARSSSTASCSPRSTRSSASWPRCGCARSARLALPVSIRIPFGGGIGAVEHHSESPEALFAHTPGCGWSPAPTRPTPTR